MVQLIITKTRLFKYVENFTPKNWKLLDKKNSDSFSISAQNIDCRYSLEPPRRGGSNEYPQSMFLSRNKKNNVYPCKAKFYYIKVGFKAVKTIYACFRDGVFGAQALCVCHDNFVNDCLLVSISYRLLAEPHQPLQKILFFFSSSNFLFKSYGTHKKTPQRNSSDIF